ncbi:MAG: hypothetical protein J5733_04315 [Bacteroidaceae bacterium]|nr:hypothetical protein [Bacteroidaceae bacterium]
MRKNLLSILLLLYAGVQSVMAQSVVLNYKNGDILGIDVSLLESVTFEEADNHEFVDLGLPSGTLWATMNVGANSPEDYGDYFAWGETETKASYYWDTYKWMNAGQSNWDQINKYTFEDGQTSGCWYSGGSFVGDGIKELTRSDDAATRNWSSKWQMPTREQFEELINPAYTTSEIKTRYGVKGLYVTGKNGKSIFLPAAGFRLITDSYSVGDDGRYWSSSLSPRYTDYASFLSFNSNGKLLDTVIRALGCCIRPVRIEEKKQREYVDLGLPSGTLWATCNVGADSPEEYGDYFAWGETEPKSDYSWGTYKWCNGTDRTLTKYCINSSFGTSDGMTELVPADDAATANWGGEWQMPSNDQMLELWLNTTSTLTTQNGVKGRLLTSKINGKSIFLPFAGGYDGTSLYGEGTKGCYWSRWIYQGLPNRADYLFFSSNDIYTNPYDRYRGQSVRPVRKK